MIPAALVGVLLCAPVVDAALNLISLNQEWQMRDQMHSQVAAEYRLLNDRASLEYLNAVGRRIAGQTPLGNQRWDFFIIQDSAVNAFNVPGGLVYVNSGLIAEADSLEEFAGVLGHEISHGAARHGTQLMTRAYGYNIVAGLLLGREAGAGKQILAQAVGTGLLTNYSRNAEHEADRLGVQYITRAGYDPNGMVEFFGKLASLRQRRPSKVEQFFSSHPLTEQRIQNVQGEISRVGNTDRLIDDTQSYQRFRSRFR
jgi:predicted Zn-dependent protease